MPREFPKKALLHLEFWYFAQDINPSTNQISIKMTSLSVLLSVNNFHSDPNIRHLQIILIECVDHGKFQFCDAIIREIPFFSPHPRNY